MVGTTVSARQPKYSLNRENSSLLVSGDEDLGNQKKPFSVPDEIAIILEEHLAKNEDDTNEKIWPTIWDFAGQDIYRAIHPIFMSSDDIYLLVFDLTKRLSEKAECRVNVGHKELTATARDGEDTNLDHLLRWMDLIHSLKKDSQSDGLSYPPVILVGTHADCVDDPRKQINSLAEGKCSDVFDEDTYLPHIADYLPIDNTKSGKSTDQEEISELRKKTQSWPIKCLIPRGKSLCNGIVLRKKFANPSGNMKSTFCWNPFEKRLFHATARLRMRATLMSLCIFCMSVEQ